VVTVTGPATTIYVGGQNAVASSGEVVGKGDIGAQTEQIFRNLEAALAAAGAELRHVVKRNILVVEGQPVGPAVVSAPAQPDFLAELEAVAVVPR